MQFDMAGHGRLVWTAAMVTVAAVAGCEKEQAKSAAPPPPPEVLVVAPQTREVQEWAEFTGRVEPVELVDIRARVSGYLDKIAFQDAADVKQGDLLFQIDARPFQADLDRAQAQLERSDAQLAYANNEVERLRPLVETGAVSRQELDKNITLRDTATAEQSGARAAIVSAKLNLEYSAITSPINGRVGEALLSVGNLISPTIDKPLTTVVQLKPIYVYFDVDEGSVLRIRAKTIDSENQDMRKIKIPVQVGLASEQGYPHEGAIDFADNKLDASTGSIRVRGILANESVSLLPGMFARVRIPVGTPRQAVLVPELAIGTDQGNKFVYVVKPDNTVEYRRVTLAQREDRLRVIDSGLDGTESVIVSGIQRVRPGVAVSAKPAPSEPPPPAAVPAKTEGGASGSGESGEAAPKH